ncbi:hypothetical protein TNCV_807931 [Trichonephila clavipes]|nr:hypothetical protein TNCV_807931 [Trichonephila clavipes]
MNYRYRLQSSKFELKSKLVYADENTFGPRKTTRSPFDLSVKECHKPDLAHQTSVPEICSSNPEEEQVKQGERRDMNRKNLPRTKVIPRR